MITRIAEDTLHPIYKYPLENNGLQYTENRMVHLDINKHIQQIALHIQCFVTVTVYRNSHSILLKCYISVRSQTIKII